jgi:hypothetical protein
VRCVYVRWAYNSAHLYTADSAFNVTAVACALAAELRVVCAQRIGSTAKLYTVTLYPVSLDVVLVMVYGFARREFGKIIIDNNQSGCHHITCLHLHHTAAHTCLFVQHLGRSSFILRKYMTGLASELSAPRKTT